MNRKILSVLICMLLAVAPALAGNEALNYRFADAKQAAELLLSNHEYYEHMSQNDLNYRMQKQDATLEELLAFAAEQTLDFTEAERDAVVAAMDAVGAVCRERGYVLPLTDNIVFAKTTMRDECDASAYTHGTQVYLGREFLEDGVSEDPEDAQFFREVVAHELFHCMTRAHPDFRADMYAILGFTVADEDLDFSPAVWDAIISNPDVERHNAFATFTIDGVKRDCAVIFMAEKPFAQPGDSFMDHMVSGLVPLDDPGRIYSADDAPDFWDVFGRNTDYAIDPEETMADNFSFTLMRGLDDASYENPEIIRAIDAYLKRGAA